MMLSTKPLVLDFSNSHPEVYQFSDSQKAVLFFQEEINTLTFHFAPHCAVNLTIFFLPALNLKSRQSKLIFNLSSGVQLDLYLGNFANYSLEDCLVFNLNGENANLKLYGASLNDKTVQKKSLLNPIHWTRQTFSEVKFFAVLKAESQSFVRCVSDIKKGASNSEAHQELRLTVLDSRAKANSDPVLLIDENEIVASHANAIGMLDQDQIFYLRSRGLSQQAAEKLIISGYFAPIFANLFWEALPKNFQEVLREFS